MRFPAKKTSSCIWNRGNWVEGNRGIEQYGNRGTREQENGGTGKQGNKGNKGTEEQGNKRRGYACSAGERTDVGSRDY